MDLTLGEYCSFNLKSRALLLKKDGRLLAERNVPSRYRIQLYTLYQFYIELVIDVKTQQEVRTDPVINLGVFELYNIR